jgi:hypothetical protein
MVLNLRVPTEEKTDGTKGSFNEDLGRVFDQFLKVGREDIFKPATGNDSLHEISNDNGVRIANFSSSKSLIEKSIMFPHHNIQNLLGRLRWKDRQSN